MWRRILASILVVVGALLLLLSSFGWWADRYFLDSERFSNKATQILDEEKVQDALAFAITQQISEQSGRDLSLAEPVIQTIVRQIVSSDPFQKPNAQCALNDAMLQSIPLYMKCGKLHFMVSSTSGQAACTTARKCSRIGCAKSADLAM